MPRRPKDDDDASERALFKLSQELGDDEEEAPSDAPTWEVKPEEPAEPVPDDLFQKAFDELTGILTHFQKTMSWPTWEEPWHKQREKVLASYNMTVDGFYAELWRRKEAKRKAQSSSPCK